jgi:hypothetical protein
MSQLNSRRVTNPQSIAWIAACGTQPMHDHSDSPAAYYDAAGLDLARASHQDAHLIKDSAALGSIPACLEIIAASGIDRNRE